LGFFVAAGLGVAMASLTRVEGLFLLIPLVLWSASRWLALRTARVRLLLGAVLGAAMLPALLVLINLVWLQSHPRWEFMRLAPFELAQTWFQSLTGSVFGAARDSGQDSVGSQARMSLPQTTWVFVHTMERGLTPLFALLMFGGNWAWRRVWWRRDTRPLVYVALGVAAGTWIHLYHAQVSSHRYPVPLVLMGSVFAALGLLGLSAWMLRLAARLHCGKRLQYVVAVAPLAIIGTVGLADALTKNHDARESWARLGRWVRQEFGPAPSLIGPQGLGTTTGYYAQGRCHAIDDLQSEGIVEAARNLKPHVVLLWARQAYSPEGQLLIERIEELGFKRVDRSRLPPGTERVFVLARERSEFRVAQIPTGTSHRIAEGSNHDW
jgi:hypothetical protein